MELWTNMHENAGIHCQMYACVFIPELNNPFSLDVFEGSLYWVSKTKGEVTTMDKFGRGVNQTLQAGLLLPHGIKVYQQYRYDLTSKTLLPHGINMIKVYQQYNYDV